MSALQLAKQAERARVVILVRRLLLSARGVAMSLET